MKYIYPSVAQVAVAPTTTVVVELDVRFADWVTLQVENEDALQTFVGLVERRQSDSLAWAPSTIGDFSSIAPLTSAMADLDTTGTAYLRLVGTMSGAGANVLVTARQGVRR